jgi:hypothetical protein
MMDDKTSASLVLVAGAIGVGWWYYHLSHPSGALAQSPQPDGTGPLGTQLGKGPDVQFSSPLAKLEAFAEKYGLKITSETGGQHNPGSLHAVGRAIDVSARGFTDDMVEKLKAVAAAWGIKLRDERTRPPGQAVWSGPHEHLEIPY